MSYNSSILCFFDGRRHVGRGGFVMAEINRRRSAGDEMSGTATGRGPTILFLHGAGDAGRAVIRFRASARTTHVPALSFSPVLSLSVSVLRTSLSLATAGRINVRDDLQTGQPTTLRGGWGYGWEGFRVTCARVGVHRGQVPAIVISRRRHSGLGVWLKFLELCWGWVHGAGARDGNFQRQLTHWGVGGYG